MIFRVNKKEQRKRKGKEWKRFWVCVCSRCSLDGVTKRKKGDKRIEGRNKAEALLGHVYIPGAF